MPHRPPFVRALLAHALAALLGVVAVTVIAPAQPAGAAPMTAGGFTTSARLSTPEVAPGASVTITAHVTAAADRTALVDVEVYDAAGRQVLQRFWDGEPFSAGAPRSFSVSWDVAAGQALGDHRVDIGVFEPGWRALHQWNWTATTVRVSHTPAPPPGHFETLPPGSALPGDAECAARVRPAAEVRAGNVIPNATTGRLESTPPPGVFGRVTGDFTGTTDEIIQWAACKWGFDEDVIRAQTAKESWWVQRTGGDWTSEPSRCAPGHGLGVEGVAGQCPESHGVQQVRYPYWGWAFPSAVTSTAFNLDAALAARRNCYEGNDTWLNTVERGRHYASGDLWGCIGTWFSGRWYTQPSLDYIAAVQDYLEQRIWTRPEFIAHQG